MKISFSLNNIIIVCLLIFSSQSFAFDEASTITALRMANSITGGFMPTDDPLFAQMVAQVHAGNVTQAALIAANSKYFTNYLARRLALQMQTPALDASIIADSDASAFVIAHLAGGPTWKPSISTLWSENQTYQVTFAINGTAVTSHANLVQRDSVANGGGYGMTPDVVDWSTQLVRTGPQQVLAQSRLIPGQAAVPSMYMAIPAKHVGGYLTASVGPNDFGSFAVQNAFAGTNLKMIEGLWIIATGMGLVDVEDTKYATTDLAKAQDVPRFVPEDNPNFYVGQGQTACIACHGGGMSNLTHGYAAVADVFDTAGGNGGGLSYNDRLGTSNSAGRKSLGSNGLFRSRIATCTLPGPYACNPDSAGVDPNQGWDLSSWQANGTLDRMGWTASITGQGLNQLGVAVGRAASVYEYFTKRLIAEICPMGNFSSDDVANIARAANPFAVVPGTDDVRTLAALVAANPTCH